MKKSLLILCLFTIGSLAKAQLTYVGAGATLTVQDQALVYCGGGWENAENTGNSTYGKVDNYGDIMVVGAGSDVFKIANTVNLNSFNLKYTSSTVYGQLYITGIPQGNGTTTGIIGKVNKEFLSDFNNTPTLLSTDVEGTTTTTSPLGQQQLALPFIGFTTDDLKAAIDPSSRNWLNLSSSTLNYTGRWNAASLYRWNNARARYDQILAPSSAVMMSSNNGNSPTDYYALPVRSQNAAGTLFTIQWNPSYVLKSFKGVPVSDQGTATQFTLSGAAAGIDFGLNGNVKNYYYERYNTYINDPFRTGGYLGVPAWASDYGQNLYQFSNPFLTNIDLSHIYATNAGNPATGVDFTIDNLVGVSYYQGGSNTFQEGYGTKTNTVYVVTASSANGSLTLGDVANLSMLVKPMTGILVKLSSAPAIAPVFNFNNLRNFKQTKRTAVSYVGPTTAKNSSAKKTISPTDIKQVAVVLYNSDNNEIGRTYYAVNSSAITGYNLNNQMQAFNNSAPIYTSEELIAGGADTSLTDRLYINTANEVDFFGKPLPLTIASATKNLDAANATSVKFELYEAGVRLDTGNSLSNGNSFYFEKDGVVTQITDDSSQAVLPGSNYNLYYGEPSSALATANVSKNSTVIYKNSSDWLIRFAKNWKSANIEVYSAAGQLIYSKKNISTSSDFVIPISQQNSMYVVKTTSENGEVVIKKILK